ncbi:MAG: hypothetical protein M3423_08085, partial [Actinomycetota bacterium]|nr:hypothetical protein [Actinomycetota bacterium]
MSSSDPDAGSRPRVWSLTHRSLRRGCLVDRREGHRYFASDLPAAGQGVTTRAAAIKHLAAGRLGRLRTEFTIQLTVVEVDVHG